MDRCCDAGGFVLLTDVVPDVLLDVRYFSTYNFVGSRIDGYEEPCVLITREAAQAVKAAGEEAMHLGWRLRVFDAYRPQRAVDHFVRWAQDLSDQRMKPVFYPEVDKTRLFEEGYIARRSGHSRGSTIDLTLVDALTGREADMGSPFDFFGEISHPAHTEGLTAEQVEKRMLLRSIMLRHGFRPLESEWWHFTLENEPFPDTYFDFPVSRMEIANR